MATTATSRNWTHDDGPAVRFPRPLTHLTPQDLAAREGVPVATVYNWRTSGYGPRGFRVGKYLRYRLEDVEAWEAAQIAAEDDR
ncbi:helix-turn-helix transcriptional regulator [Micrococcus luteus]|uniref:helix-turn-helix transcriptional regulator n=1 Tax=Micrococcus luteus TaxID=1270 RepID=UPI003671FDF7